MSGWIHRPKQREHFQPNHNNHQTPRPLLSSTLHTPTTLTTFANPPSQTASTHTLMDHDPTTPPPARESSSENPLLRASNPLVSDLEQEVLDEYSRLLGNVNKVPLQRAIAPPSIIFQLQLSQPTTGVEPPPRSRRRQANVRSVPISCRRNWRISRAIPRR
jgi:hypothetical protein